MMIMLVALALSPSGRVLSLDAYLNRSRESRNNKRLLNNRSPFATWPLLLIQWLLALFYLSAVYSKLTTSGFDWANGYTLQYYLIQDGLRSWGSYLGIWVAQFHTLIWLAQWAVLLFQATFFLILIFPALKWIYVPLGFCFHVGILLTLGAGFQMWLVCYAVFIPWAGFIKAILRRTGADLWAKNAHLTR